MTSLGLGLRQLRHEQRIYWRNPAAVFFTVGMPVMLLLIFGSLNEGERVAGFGNQPFARFFVAGMISFGVVATCYGNLASRFVYRRETGLLLRVRATPLPLSSFMVGLLANAVAVTAVLVSTLLLIAWVVYDVGVPGRWPVLVLTVLIGSSSCCALGLAVSTFIPNIDAADAVIFGSLLPVVFVSGAFMPVPADSLLGRVGSVLPVRHIIDATLSAFDQRPGAGLDLGHHAVVLAWGALGVLIAMKRFRWEPSRQ